MPLGIDFLMIFIRFVDPKWKQVETKIDQKSMLTSKDDFLKKLCFSQGKTMILKVLGVEVGTKKQSKIEQKMKS